MKNETFGERLLSLFSRTHTPRPKIEKEIGVSPSTVTKWINGEGISDDNLFLLAKALGVNWVALKYGEDVYRQVCEDYIDERYGEEVRRYKLNTEILTAVLEMTNNEVYVIDDKDRFMYVSRCAGENLGYSITELSSMSPYDVKPTLNKEEYKAMKNAVVNKDDVISFVIPHLRRDGSEYEIKVKFKRAGNAYIALGDVVYYK